MRASRRAWNWILAVDRFVRLYLLFYTATWVLLGASSVRQGLTIGELGALLGVTLCIHIYTYVLNDVIDLPIDRTQSARRDDPLVRGDITRRSALLIALIQPLLTIPLTWFLGGSSAAYGTLAAAFVTMGAYNLWGKRCRFPPITDAIQGISLGCLPIYAAQALGMTPTALTWMVAAYAAVYTVFINGIHGSFRDLDNDFARGVRTTAIILGARPGPAQGERCVPTVLLVYAWCLLVVLIGINVVLMLRNEFNYSLPVWVVTTAILGALNAWAALLHPQVMRPHGSAPDVAWRLQIYIMVIVMPVAFLAYADLSVIVVLVLLNAFALVLFDCTSAVTRCVWVVIGAARDQAHEDTRLPARITHAD